MRVFKAICEGFKDQLAGQRPIMLIHPSDEPEKQKDFKGEECYIIVCEDFQKAGEMGTMAELIEKADSIMANQLEINKKLEDLGKE